MPSVQQHRAVGRGDEQVAGHRAEGDVVGQRADVRVLQVNQIEGTVQVVQVRWENVC